MGELDKRIKFVSDKNDEEIRDIKDGKVDITELINAINIYRIPLKGLTIKWMNA